MNTSDLKKLIPELKALVDNSTFGEWTWEPGPPTLYAGRTSKWHGLNLLGRLDPDSNTPANLDFICGIRNAAPELISRLEQLEKAIEALQDIWAMTNPDDAESYRADDASGCMDTVFGTVDNLLKEIRDDT